MLNFNVLGKSKKNVIFVALLLLFGLPQSVNAQFLGMSVDELAGRMYNSGLKAVYELNLFNRDYNGVYSLAYRDIYETKQCAPISYFYMGACLELGMGTSEVNRSKAQAHYEYGARLGSAECKQRLRDISTSGWMTANSANRERFARTYGKPGSAGGTGNGGGYNPTPSGNSKYKCSSCNGTGRCEWCGGSGWHYNKYDGHNHVCTSCNKTGRCAKCNGRGTL